MSYKDLDDEAKLEEAIKFVATGQDMPAELVTFLRENDLYEYIMQPVESRKWERSLKQ